MAHKHLLLLDTPQANVLHPLGHEQTVCEELQLVHFGVLVQHLALVLARTAYLMQRLTIAGFDDWVLEGSDTLLTD